MHVAVNSTTWIGWTASSSTEFLQHRTSITQLWRVRPFFKAGHVAIPPCVTLRPLHPLCVDSSLIEFYTASRKSSHKAHSRRPRTSNCNLTEVMCLDRSLAIQAKPQTTARLLQDTGAQIWESGQLLSNILLSEYCKQLPKMRVLELGSGTGIGGLTAAAVGANVVLTDGSVEVLPLLEENVRLNVEANLLDGCAEVCKLLWGDAHDIALVQSKGPYDLIIGADLLYSPVVFSELLDSLAKLCVPDHTEVLLTFRMRQAILQRIDIFFAEAAQRSFELITPITKAKSGKGSGQGQLCSANFRFRSKADSA